MTGREIHKLANALWPINRSLTGEGVRQTLRMLQTELPGLVIHEVPSGTQVFDWTVPKEWHIRDAYIQTPDGRKICHFHQNNLHLVGYSIPVNKTINLTELKNHLYSLPEQPDAIPYITSYYKERWGFCLTHNELLGLEEGEYQVVVDSELFNGSMSYGELIIPGKIEREIFLSTYICHPSMANNELSGPCVTSFIVKELLKKPRKYTYRIVFIPETIGSITYLSRHLTHLKSKVFAGYNISCVGDDRAYSYLPSRHGQTPSDLAANHVLKHICPEYVSYNWKDRGSDERQYCAPGIDLPIASIMRTKYGEYDEYHTSLDDLKNVVTPEGLQGGFNALWRSIEALENNCYPLYTVFGEPQLGKRGLYPTLSTKNSGHKVRLMMDILTWSDGKHSLIEIANLCGAPVWDLYPIIQTLQEQMLITLNDVVG